ncbi:lipocalin family protein [Methylophilus sp. 5]|uniref:lipocalin family protein n=1 Tax=Methylophilus sp. 5 TaxID=1112274 RepID=UPI0018DEE5EC|nr:lipocalin family protein [Methylophilus sp. 5]
MINILGLSACRNLPPMPTVSTVDIERFMGDWYVIAAIPTVIERDPYNPIEHYQQNMDGTIATTFSFRQGGFDGALKTYHPTGTIVPNSGNAEWRMQFVWPFKSEYLIAYLSEDYQQTVIARNKRDYVWLMSRQPHLDPNTYQALVAKIKAMGYDTSKLQVFPHQP